MCLVSKKWDTKNILHRPKALIERNCEIIPTLNWRFVVDVSKRHRLSRLHFWSPLEHSRHLQPGTNYNQLIGLFNSVQLTGGHVFAIGLGGGLDLGSDPRSFLVENDCGSGLNTGFGLSDWGVMGVLNRFASAEKEKKQIYHQYSVVSHQFGHIY